MILGRLRSNRRLALLGLFVLAGLAAVGVVVGIGLGGSSTSVLPTTGLYAPISVPKPLVAKPGLTGALAADPDSMIRQGQDLQTILSPLSGSHRYRLTVTNVSGIGFIDSFEWYPPNGVSIVKVTGSSAGHCSAGGTGGLGGKLFQGVLANPEITCAGVNLKPPSCTCKGDGGEVTVSFVADQNFGLSGAARIISATPVRKIIPSSPPVAQSPDEPLCAAGQASTKAKPCTGG